MLYKISERTWLDMPKWKCRKEFADLWNAKHTPKQDVELINKLKAKCDKIAEEHKQKQQRKDKKKNKR